MTTEATYTYTEELYRIPTPVTIAITQSWDKLSDAERSQLERITEALHKRIHPSLRLEAFRIIHVTQLDLSEWTERPPRLIYFGPLPKGLNYYELIEAGPTRMVLSESLADLIPNEGARTRLWQALRQLFS